MIMVAIIAIRIPFISTYKFYSMPQKNLLKLHEAIVVALINMPDRKGSFNQIANYIEKKGLFDIRKGNIPLSTQIMLRTCQSKGRYLHLFKKVGEDVIKLRNI